MNPSSMTKIYPRIAVAVLAGSLWLSACTPAALAQLPPQPAATLPPAPAATLPPEPTALPTVAPEPTSTSIPDPVGTSPQVSLDSAAMASSLQTDAVAAVPAGESTPNWGVMPGYTRLTLQGYPISNPAMQPQIFIYPVKELAEANPEAGKVTDSLKKLIAEPQEIPGMPFLPLINSKQIMHASVQYLDFKSGQGLRYLTQFNNGIAPINNQQLIYTYQGLTSDGKYHVAAILPVTHSSLPADGQLTGKEPQDPEEFAKYYQKYLSDQTSTLNTQPAGSFAPDLTQLDAMMSSLEVK